MDLFAHTLIDFSMPAGRRAIARWSALHPELAALHDLAAALNEAECDVPATVTAAGELVDTTAVTRTLVAAFQAGDRHAASALLLAKRRWILRVARHASGADADERLGGVVAHFMAALSEVSAGHGKLEGQLFWRSLRAVHAERNRARISTTPDAELDPAGPDVMLDVEHWMSIVSLLDWARDRGHVSARDLAVIAGMYDRDNVVSVRALAREWGEPEDRLESALRRAVRRLRGKVLEHRDDLDRFLIMEARPRADRTHAGQLAA